MAPTHIALMPTGTPKDGGHSILLVVSKHRSLSLYSCSFAILARLTACCIATRLLFSISVCVQHGSDPSVILNLPAAHGAHTPPSGPVKPALHLQDKDEILPGGDVELGGQNKHVTAPGIGWYIVAGHIVHGPPFGPENPALHRQPNDHVLPAGDMESRGHDKHACGPIIALNVSSGHLVHVPPFGPV